MFLAVSGSVFSTPKPLHIHLFIIMSTICIILYGRFWGHFDSLLGRFD